MENLELICDTQGMRIDKYIEIDGITRSQVQKLIEEGKAPREKQEDDFTLAPMLNKEMSEINWNEKTALETKKNAGAEYVGAEEYIEKIRAEKESEREMTFNSRDYFGEELNAEEDRGGGESNSPFGQR